MFYFLLTAFARMEYEEKPLNEVEYIGNEDLSNIGFENAFTSGDGITLRASSEKGSIVHFENKNPYDEWSFSFTINELNLSPGEVAGVYLWYTTDRIESGSFKGANPKFEGMVAGIEFTGKAVDLIVTSNEGDVNMHALEDVSVLRDSLNQERIKDVKDITVKVINTFKNFKMELYDGNKLLYDNLRFKDASVLGDRLKGKYFAISSYYDKVPLEKKFTLKNAQLFKREEFEHYEPLNAKSQKPEEKTRLFDEISHSDKGTRHLISNLEHYIQYIRTILGGPAGQSIASAANDTTEEIEKIKESLKSLHKTINDGNHDDYTDAIETINTRITDSELKLKGMQLGISDVTRKLMELKEISKKRFRIIIIGIIGVSAVIVLLSVVERYYKIKYYSRIN
ncbi:hypothetical protein H312_00873 [Anncaliia algerae PRA339]|uniref:L-type lectin-like domain-containing protein n=1 Tax=Anncaliia algerae PRA339 TaxID=1288291 RepID=A0A059F3B7_9MICR|nr:hypothetical protein H312_00873 [Anncaliia algerae PRA339]